MAGHSRPKDGVATLAYAPGMTVEITVASPDAARHPDLLVSNACYSTSPWPAMQERYN